ncbi:hypothetical protein C3V43_13135 [Bacteroides heparinolyticus]|nr:hypothetical protein C3V43_13135 [Bacteroides heparinolyticus]
MLIYVFPPHYQLVCANSYTSSFSLISYACTSECLHLYKRRLAVVQVKAYGCTSNASHLYNRKVLNFLWLRKDIHPWGFRAVFSSSGRCIFISSSSLCK